MRLHALIFLAGTVLLASTSRLAAEENAEQRQAMAALQKLGATFVADASLPGRPVVAVDLDHSDVHGDTLKLLKLFPHLHSVRWREVWSLIGQEEMKTLGGLTQLRNLDILAAHIQGDWLKSLEGLANLESLTLSWGDGLTDEGLRHLRRLTTLRTLNLPTAFRITDEGLVQLRGLTKLRHLDLSGTEISDDGLVYLKTFSYLETLNLRGTAIGDNGLAHLKDLVKLRSLDLSVTKVTDKGLKHLKQLTALRHINLDAEIVGDNFEDLKGLTSLRSLILGPNVVQGENLAKLKELKSLRELTFSTARFKDDDCKYIGQLTHLESLKIYRARWLTDKGLQHLWQLTHLRDLELSHLEEMTDKSLAGLAALSNLRLLRLRGLWKISDVGIRHLRRSRNLECLDLEDLPISKAGWQIIPELNHLQSLCLAISTVSDETLEDLSGLKGLRELQISGANIGDAALLSLRELPALQSIDLSLTGVTNRGLGHLKSLPNLRTLVVEHSKVTEEGIAAFRVAKPGVKIIHYTVGQTGYSPPTDIVKEKPTSSQVLLPLVRALIDANDTALQLDVLRGMHEALRGRRRVAAPAGWSQVYRKLANSKNAEIREKVLQLSVLFGDPQALAALRQTAADPKADGTARRNALQTLIEKRPPDLLPLLRKLVGDRGVRRIALRGLAFYSDPQIPSVILEQYAAFTDAEKADAIATLASRPAYALTLLDAMEKDRVPRRDLSAFTVRQLLAFKDKNLTERLTKVWGSIRPPSAEKATLLAKYKAMVPADVLKKADRKHGRLLFSRTCAVCHTLFGEGGKIGPDLTGSQRTSPEYLLTKLIDPSAVVARDYQMTIITTKAGRTMSGLVKEENDKTLTLQTQNEVVRLEKADIDERQRSPQSMMPDGLLAMLSAAEVRDLIAYVSGGGQVPLPASKTSN